MPSADRLRLGALSSVRFVQFLIDDEFTQHAPDLPAQLVSDLTALNSGPLQFAVAPTPETMGSLLRGWLDQYDDEPEDDDYWTYQAAVIVEYLLQLKNAEGAVEPLARMVRYCLDFAYFLDEELDRGDEVHDEAEAAWWQRLVALLSTASTGDPELLGAARADETRIVQAAREVMNSPE
jgi:hypothetical protein